MSWQAFGIDKHRIRILDTVQSPDKNKLNSTNQILITQLFLEAGLEQPLLHLGPCSYTARILINGIHIGRLYCIAFWRVTTDPFFDW